MTLLAAGFLLGKATLLFAVPLAALYGTRRYPPAVRHVLCLLPLAASLLLPLTSFGGHAPIPVHIEAFAGAARPSATAGVTTKRVTLAGAIWLTGFCLVLLRVTVGHWRLNRIVRAAEKLTDHDGIPVLLAHLPVPLVAGLWTPVILMPTAAATWRTRYFEAALRHERAHVARRDLWANLIARIACAVWWFHPLVWLLAAKQRTEQEAACDDAVISGGFDAASYAGALLSAAASPFRLSISGSSMFTQNDLTKRIQRLADCQPPKAFSKSMSRRVLLGFAALLTVVTLLTPVAAQNEPYKVEGDVLAPRVLVKVDPAYPPDAKTDEIQGTVALHVVILPSGLAGDISVAKSPDPRLDDAAIAAVRQWTFAPGTLRGKSVAVRAVIEINFRLN